MWNKLLGLELDKDNPPQTTPEAHQCTSDELEKKMMLTLKDTESVTSNMSDMHRSST